MGLRCPCHSPHTWSKNKQGFIDQTTEATPQGQHWTQCIWIVPISSSSLSFTVYLWDNWGMISAGKDCVVEFFVQFLIHIQHVSSIFNSVRIKARVSEYLRLVQFLYNSWCNYDVTGIIRETRFCIYINTSILLKRSRGPCETNYSNMK